MRFPLRFSLALLGTAMSLAAADAAAGARDDLAAFTRGLKGLDAGFTQQVYDAKDRLKETSSGRVALSVPRLFRWEYVKPYPQLIVADGKTVWVYEPDLQQATRRPQGSEEQSSPLVALFDPGQLDTRFVVEEAGASDGVEWLALKPKGDAAQASFRTARLGFGSAGLERMSVVDQLGQRTEIRFRDWKRNPAFEAGTFRFVPERGVDVIGE